MHRGQRTKRGASERTACAQVTAITQMTDAQRLALIKDVAGTNVYEEKKGESEKILNDSLRKMDEIKNVRALCFHQCNELASRMASRAYFCP
jgi:chromosome segregation ATPase